MHGIELIEFSDGQLLRINNAPTAADDLIFLELDEDGRTLTGSVNLLENDRDNEDGEIDASTIKLLNQPFFGSVSVNDDGVLTYTHVPGTDDVAFATVAYEISDSAGLAASSKVDLYQPCNRVSGTPASEKIYINVDSRQSRCDGFTMFGVGGSDEFVITKRAGAEDIIADFNLDDSDDGKVAADTLNFDNFKSLTRASQVLKTGKQRGNDALLVLEGGIHTLLLKGVQLSSLELRHFAGRLGLDPIVVVTNNQDNKIPYIQSKPLRYDVHAQYSNLGSRYVNFVENTAEHYRSTFVTWDRQTDANGEAKVWGKYYGVDGKETVKEFQLTASGGEQSNPVASFQNAWAWNTVIWEHIYTPNADPTKTPLDMGLRASAFFFNGRARCEWLAGTCLDDSNHFGKSDIGTTNNIARFRGAQLSGHTQVSTNGPPLKESHNVGYGYGITVSFYYRTASFCCAIYARTKQTAPTAKQNFGKLGYYRVDDASGTILPKTSIRYRDTSAALNFEGVEGHPVAHGWTYQQTYSAPSDLTTQPEICSIKRSQLFFDDGAEDHPLGHQTFGVGFETFKPVLSKELGVAEPIAACSAISNCAALKGKIAIIQRGACSFVLKALTVQACDNVLAIILVNNVDGNIPPDMGIDNVNDGDAVSTLIASVNKAAGLRLIESVKGDSTTTASILCGNLGFTAHRLAFRVFNTFTGTGEARVDLTPMPTLVHDDAVRERLAARAAGSTTALVTTTFVIVPLFYNALPGSYHKYNQFAVVYGARRSATPLSLNLDRRLGAEAVEIAFLTRAEKVTDPFGVHTSCAIESPKFVAPNLDTKGIAAVNINGGIAVVWAHQFPSIDHPIIMLQIISYGCEPMNVATAISDTSDFAGAARLPKISISPGTFHLTIHYLQAKGLDTDTPTEEINMRRVSTNELYKTVPEGVSAAINATEDTLLEISIASLLANALEETTCIGSTGTKGPDDGACDSKQSCGCPAGSYVKSRRYNDDEGNVAGNCWYCEDRRQLFNTLLDRENDGSDMLTLVDLKIIDAALVLKEGSEPIARGSGSTAAFGTLRRSGRVVQKAGLIAEYLDGVDSYVEKSNTGVQSFFPKSSREQLASSIVDTLNFPQDVKTIVNTLTQVPNGAGRAWPGLPHYMAKNFVARIYGKVTVEAADTFQFSVNAKSAATLFVDGLPVISTRTYNFTNCRCNGVVNTQGGGSPKCNTLHLKRRVCYVDRGVCSDSMQSSLIPNVDLSFMACTSKISNPSEATIIVEGTGIVALKPGRHDIALHFVRSLNEGDAYYDVKWRKGNASVTEDEEDENASESTCNIADCPTLESVSKDIPGECPVEDLVVTWGEGDNEEPFYQTRHSFASDRLGNSLGLVDLFNNSQLSMAATVAEPFEACEPLDVKSDGGIMIVGAPTSVCSFATQMKHAKDAGATRVLSVASAIHGTYYGRCLDTETELCSYSADILLLQMENKDGRRLVEAVEANNSLPVTIRCNNGMPHSRFLSELEKPCCGSNFESIDEALLSHDDVVNADLDIQYEYVPPQNAHGTVTFEMVVASRDGPRTTGTATVSIAGINDSPTAVDDVFQFDAKTDEKSLKNAGIFSKLTVKRSDLLANDRDVDSDNDDLQIPNITGKPNYGILGDSDEDDTAFTYTPSTG